MLSYDGTNRQKPNDDRYGFGKPYCIFTNNAINCDIAEELKGYI